MVGAVTIGLVRARATTPVSASRPPSIARSHNPGLQPAQSRGPLGPQARGATFRGAAYSLRIRITRSGRSFSARPKSLVENLSWKRPSWSVSTRPKERYQPLRFRDPSASIVNLLIGRSLASTTLPITRISPTSSGRWTMMPSLPPYEATLEESITAEQIKSAEAPFGAFAGSSHVPGPRTRGGRRFDPEPRKAAGRRGADHSRGRPPNPAKPQ